MIQLIMFKDEYFNIKRKYVLKASQFLKSTTNLNKLPKKKKGKVQALS